MPKILILANNDIGLYKFRRELIENLIEHNEVFISLPEGEFVEPLVELGCNFIRTEISRRGTNPITDLKLMIKYFKIINEVKPDIILTYTIKPNVYGGMLSRMLNVPYIVNVTGLGTAVENGGLLQKITIMLYKISLKRASCVFFQNAENAEFFKSKGIVNGRSRLIPGSGVNLDQYYVMDYPEKELTRFLFISRIMKQKGIDQYLEAAEYIGIEYSNTEFHILGYCEEEYESKLRDMESRNIIHYHGIQSDVRKYHKVSHCTIHPSYYPEGMSNVLLESSACSRPIITTDKSGCKEILDNGINGFMIEQQSSKDLIEKIEMFLNLEYEDKIKMGLAGREKS